MTEEEQLKQKVYAKFFEERDYSTERTLQLIDQFANFGTTNKSGDVFIKNASCTGKEKVAICVLARFLGNQLEQSLPKAITIEETAKFAGMNEAPTTARLKELVDEGLLVREGKGVYTARSLFSVEKWLHEMAAKYGA